MSFVICEKHKKVQKVSSKVITNGYICMNRYCPDSFKIICANCKNDHRDHAIKVLSIEDTSFLLERLLKLPFKQPNRYMGETLDIMKKLKLTKEFRKKIDILEKQIQKQALKLIQNTQSLVNEYNACKLGVDNLLSVLATIQQPTGFQNFYQNSQKLLCNLDYNFKKDKLQYGNASTKQKQDKRRKTLESAKRKIQQVRDYSMKIIEVILHNGESDQQQQDQCYQKKHYDLLKNQLSIDKDQTELQQQISQLKNSKSTANKSRIRRLCLDQQSQTQESQENYVEINSQLSQKIKQLQELHENTQNEFNSKLNQVIQEKENLENELNNMKTKFQEKKKVFKELQLSLRENKLQRFEKQKAKDDVVKKIINLWQWKGINSDDRLD